MTADGWVLIIAGEAHHFTDFNDVLENGQLEVDQRLTDHYRHKQPESLNDLDIRLHKLGGESLHELPLQEWVDKWYSDQKVWLEYEEAEKALKQSHEDMTNLAIMFAGGEVDPSLLKSAVQRYLDAKGTYLDAKRREEQR